MMTGKFKLLKILILISVTLSGCTYENYMTNETVETIIISENNNVNAETMATISEDSNGQSNADTMIDIFEIVELSNLYELAEEVSSISMEQLMLSDEILNEIDIIKQNLICENVPFEDLKNPKIYMIDDMILFKWQIGGMMITTPVYYFVFANGESLCIKSELPIDGAYLFQNNNMYVVNMFDAQGVTRLYIHVFDLEKGELIGECEVYRGLGSSNEVDSFVSTIVGVQNVTELATFLKELMKNKWITLN